MKLVLQERGTDVKGMTADKMREILGSHPDFSSQTTIVEVVQSRGHELEKLIDLFAMCNSLCLWV